jgi:hypothetical protein
LQEAAAVDRQLLNFLARNHSADAVGFDVDVHRGGGDVHDFARLADFHVQIERQDLARGNSHVAVERPESRELGCHLILAGPERRRRERTLRVGGEMALDPGGRVADGDRRSWKDGFCLIAYGSGHRADRRLRDGNRRDENDKACTEKRISHEYL